MPFVMDTRIPQVICRLAERWMNAAFNAVSDAMRIIGNINAADAIRIRPFRKTSTC
ncbi:hypothetical protein AM571_CH01995 [Rhizobium etli 8C-3]|uniref:Uncharacterized protein n=1 Tax=Rhizobium etli 8C-3 TaxID=538025 RepID=A0A1L5P3T5_RHIET|nr:hypothetical protein AM571_CH01995 [Rhizobium etli 8C-3]